MRTVSILAACTLLAATAPAQKVGEEAPDLTWTKTFVFGEVPNKKLSELRGSVVLLEFWGTH